MVKQVIKENINCPRCSSNQIIKNGRSRGKQRYKCKNCNRHFQEANSSLRPRSSAKPKNSQIPARAIILLTSHRSGSTWLSDALRCHPAIEYYPTPILYEELGLHGRRYPGDLSNQTDCTYEIEVQPGKLDKIPQFDISQDLKPAQKKLEFEPYAIEKCHPSFFEFDPQLFIKKIEHLENLGIEVKLVYLTRDPKSLMTSFLNYQQRKPSWYKTIVGEKLINFVTETYQCITEISKRRSGLVLDYSEIRINLPQSLGKIYKALWSDLTKQQENYLRTIGQLAPKYTSREQRVVSTNSPFLGKKEGNIREGDKKHQNFFDEHQELIEHCYACYKKITT